MLKRPSTIFVAAVVAILLYAWFAVFDDNRGDPTVEQDSLQSLAAAQDEWDALSLSGSTPAMVVEAATASICASHAKVYAYIPTVDPPLRGDSESDHVSGCGDVLADRKWYYASTNQELGCPSLQEFFGRSYTALSTCRAWAMMERWQDAVELLAAAASVDLTQQASRACTAFPNAEGDPRWCVNGGVPPVDAIDLPTGPFGRSGQACGEIDAQSVADSAEALAPTHLWGQCMLRVVMRVQRPEHAFAVVGALHTDERLADLRLHSWSLKTDVCVSAEPLPYVRTVVAAATEAEPPATGSTLPGAEATREPDCVPTWWEWRAEIALTWMRYMPLDSLQAS